MLITAAIAPALILLWYVYNKDTEPEPTRLIVKGFFLGGLATFASTVISGPLLEMDIITQTPADIVEAVGLSFLGAAIPEECAKLFMLWLLLRNNPYFDEHYDGIVYAASVGLGFAAFENLLYVISSGAGWFDVAVTRAFFAVPGHFGFAVAMGYYYSLYHFKGNKAPFGTKWKILLVPVLLHGLYDTICFIGDLTPAIAGFASIVLIVFCLILFRKTRRRILSESRQNERPPFKTASEYFDPDENVRTHGYDINRDWTDRPEDQ